METAGWHASKVRQGLQAAARKDHSFATGEILGSMCTQPHEAGLAAYEAFLPTNLGDPDHFPGAAGLEQQVLEDFVQLVHGGPAASARLLTGGTEANLLACYIAREVTERDKIVVSEAAHFSFEKAARMLGMELIVTPAKDHRSDPGAMAVDDAALLVGIAGSTELGLVDDIAAIAKTAREMDAMCHVDAAFGGYVLPFVQETDWDLRVDGVTSIGMDPHKMGQAPVPAGALVLKDGRHWDAISVETSYVSTETQSTLMGTRPGAAAAAVWAVHRSLGWDGYRQATDRCLANTLRLAKGIEEAGLALVHAPQLNVVTFRADDPVSLQEALADLGFRLNVVPRLGGLRIVVGPHITQATVERFLEIL